MEGKSMVPIVEAVVFDLEYRLEGYKLSYGVITGTTANLVKLTDADGVVGWGEADAMQPFTEESPGDVAEVLEKELLPIVLGEQDPEPAHIDKLLDAVRPGKHLLGKGAISMALLDIKGKRLGVPVAELLGKVLHQTLPVSWPLNNGTAEDDIAVVDEKMKEGFFHYTLKMGAKGVDVADEVKRVWALEAYYGDKVTFRADANMGWISLDAAKFLQGVAGSKLAFLEQPIAKENIEGMAVLNATTTIPLSADESLTGMEQAREIIAIQAADILSIKSSKNGGPLRAKDISELAEQHGIKINFNSMLEGGITQAASLHHAVTTPNIHAYGHAFMSTLRLEGDPTNFNECVDNGIVHLPKAPGLGIKVDEELVQRTALNIRTIKN